MASVYDYDLLTGTVKPDTQDVLTEVQEEYKQAFGQDLDTDPNTPEGLLINAETIARVAVADNNAAIANQINPNIAGGIFLDAICALTGLQRVPNTRTRVTGVLTGVAGTVIPAGSQAKDTNEITYSSLTQITLLASPAVNTVQFEADVDGAILVSANTLTSIVSTIIGWETVNNPDPQDQIGSSSESDALFRNLRRNTLALQGSMLAVAIISALFATPGVTSVGFRENTADTEEVIDGVTMVPHSIYACVDGGSNFDVAQTLASKKSGGCAYNNGASSHPEDVEYTVPISGQVMHILFDRPDIINVLVRVTVQSNSAIQDPIASVVNAILKYVAGELSDEPGLQIGTAVSCFELGGAVNREAPGLYIVNVETKKVGGDPYSNASIPIAIWERASIIASSISVVLV